MTEQDYLKLWQQVTSKPITNHEVAFAALVAAAERKRFAWTQEHWTEYERNIAAAAKAEENEACAKVCDDKAMHCETKAQEAIEAGEHDEVSAIRSTAWQISICAAAIRSRGQTK